MSINIKGLTAQAFGIARALAPDALPTCTIRLQPTTIPDPINDTETTTWGIEITDARPVAYSAKEEREKQPVETKLKSFAFPASELPDGAEPEQEGEIIQSGKTWNVYRTEIDPSGSLLIFHCRA